MIYAHKDPNPLRFLTKEKALQFHALRKTGKCDFSLCVPFNSPEYAQAPFEERLITEVGENDFVPHNFEPLKPSL